MGRGKKKDPKKKEEEAKDVEGSMSSLAISSEASTSAVTLPPEEEDFGGLTGGGGKKKKTPNKQEAAAVTAEPPKPVEPAQTQSKEQLKQEEAEDEEFEGLTGAGSNKKKRPRKKKGPEATQPVLAQAKGPPPTVQAPPQQHQGPPQAFPGAPPQQYVGPPQGFPGGPPQQYQGPPQGFPGGPPQQYQGPPQGFPGGPPQQYLGPPQGFPGGPPQQYQGPPQGFPGGPPQQYLGPPQGFPGGPPHHHQGPQVAPGVPPQHAGPLPGFPSGPPQQYQGPAQTFPGAPQQQPQLGRGRGQAPFGETIPKGPPASQAPPQAFPGATQQQPQLGRGRGQIPWGETIPRGTPVTQAPPPSEPVPRGPPAAAQQQAATALPATEIEPQRSKQTKTTVCRFQIPDKYIGKSVRAIAVNVLANYLPMIIKAMPIYRYDVDIKPERPKKMFPLIFNTFLQQKFPRAIVAFDQFKNFYSVKKLPNVTATARFEGAVQVKDPNGKEMNFTVSFKATGVVDLGTLNSYVKGGTSLSTPTEAIQCIDVVLRQGTLQNYVKAGRTFFRKPTQYISLGDGLELWTGLFQSAIFTSRPYINIDVAHKGFPTHQSIIDLMKEFRLDTQKPLEDQPRWSVEALRDMVKGMKVMAQVGGDTKQKREYMCNGFSLPANRQKFIMTDTNGKQVEMTVAEYFAREKKIRLRLPHMNCMWVGPRDRSIHFPLELCEVAPNQVQNKQLNDRQLATIVKYAATPPDQRKAKIDTIIRDMNYSANPFYKEFGLDISSQFSQVPARILPPPMIKYGDKSVKPNNGAWWSSRMLQGTTIDRWGIMAVALDAGKVRAEGFVREFKNSGSGMGIRLAEPMMMAFNVPQQRLEECIRKAKADQLQLLVVVVPARPADVYQQVKKIAERTVGMLTQCIKENTMMRLNQQTAKNILLKVNAKLMGVNHIIDATTLPTCLKGGGVMVVGADVTHPSPDQQNIPSIAAVTASIDANCFQYNMGLSIQTPKKEMIVEFEDIMVEHLKAYKQKQNSLPKKIYIYRDGVSEGQFAEVLNNELVAVYNAYQRMTGTPAKPEVLFLLVQKRHHTRLFNPTDLSKNVTAGTVVDTDIVHSRELDFYLVSHAAIKGTARPTRYHCIRNDGKMPHDEVEQLTFYLCHLYSRCSRSVSYPTPTYYAHLACLRARVLTFGERHNNDELEKKPMRLRVLETMQRINPMFFV